MARKEWTIRVVQGHTDRDKLPGIWIEQFRRLGFVKLLAENDNRMVFEIAAPHGTNAVMWADMNSERMRSFGLNAVAAPKWDGYEKVNLIRLAIEISCETSDERKLLDAIATLMETPNFSIDSKQIELSRGDIIQIDGYELVAAINYATGDSMVVVVHNNSTHFLVFIVDDGHINGGTDLVNVRGRFIESYRYDDRDHHLQYAKAIAEATGIAIGHLSDN